MPEEVEIDTKELQAAVAEMHEEREERHKDEKEASWLRYVSLSTAILAVFAAMAVLQSGGRANEAMIWQIKASDAWTGYQADRQTDHLYTVQANSLLDSGAQPEPRTASNIPAHRWSQRSADARLSEYLGQVQTQKAQEARLSAEAERLEKDAEGSMDQHDRFARSVALIQVAIALSAVAALTKSKPIWYGSLAVGVFGIVLYFFGYL